MRPLRPHIAMPNHLPHDLPKPDHFDALLDATLQQRAHPVMPTHLEQRLLARLAVASGPAPTAAAMFRTYESVNVRRSAWSSGFAFGAHVAVIALLGLLIAKHVQISAPVKTPMLLTDVSAPPPPPAPKPAKMGGGGGQVGPTPVTQGHPPKFEAQPLLPPKAPPLEKPKLAVEPSINVQTDLKMADNKMPDIGMANSNLKGFSMGNGNGSGLGSGNGNGMGPGSGGNTGGGVYSVGGAVKAPTLNPHADPEFSEEARKAKFSGNVQVYVVVDEQGNPSHVKVVRGVGMGLDEKAVENVRTYKFRPATKDGKPVKVGIYIDVNFQLF